MLRLSGSYSTSDLSRKSGDIIAERYAIRSR